MNKYMITYDLDRPGQNYDGLVKRLRELQARRVQLSVWVVRTSWTAVQLRDDLRRYIDANDRLLVVGLTGEAAWTNVLVSLDEIKQLLAA